MPLGPSDAYLPQARCIFGPVGSGENAHRAQRTAGSRLVMSLCHGDTLGLQRPMHGETEGPLTDW